MAATHIQCPIVGVGASAGGLEAFQEFLKGAEVGHGVAYVLVQHLDPTHESLMPELLSRRTDLAVKSIEDAMTIEPDTVYLIPPNAELRIEQGQLKLFPFDEPRGRRRPIDVFFASLAHDQGESAAAIVLSGTGGDGSAGVRLVKEAGGLTIAQEPAGAKYDGMPTSAVATGCIDITAPADEMVAIVRQYFSRVGRDAFEQVDDKEASFVEQVAKAVRYRTGHDFSNYKRASVLRRLSRRMQIVGITDPTEYLNTLLANAEEADQLFSDLLIHVTRFFRDSDAFDALRSKVINSIVAGRTPDERIRVWIPGCSSGEEAYSVAILLAEALDRSEHKPEVQIFATDIDSTVLEIARNATYPPEAVKDIPATLLDRYFEFTDKGYRIVQRLRDMVRVSSHSLIKDPPFSRMDLICCRNLLIYLDGSLQSRVIPIFHYALRPGGHLFLGSSETISGNTDLFDVEDLDARIYSRRDGKPRPIVLPIDGRPLGGSSLMDTRPAQALSAFNEKELSRRLTENHAPPHVVINRLREVIHASPSTGRYLELSPGRPSLNLRDLTRKELKPTVNLLLDQFSEDASKPLRRSGSAIEFDGELHHIDLSIENLGDGNALLVFQDARDVVEIDPNNPAIEVEFAEAFNQSRRVRALEEELGEAQQTIRTTIEELETSNEELKSSNEEMMSMNEELQSANEELTTINDELQEKNQSLQVANSDIQNLLDSTRIATVFLDERLCVRTYTPSSLDLFRFVDHDRGRALMDVKADVDTSELVKRSSAVLQAGKPIDFEITASTGFEFLVAIRPYRSFDNATTGVVLTFTDISKLREYDRELAHSRQALLARVAEIEDLYDAAPQGMALIDADMKFIRMNRQLGRYGGLTLDQSPDAAVTQLVPGIATQVEAPIRSVLTTGKPITNMEMWGRADDEEAANQLFEADWYPVRLKGDVDAVGLIVRDVTEQRRIENELHRVMRELQHRVKNSLANVIALVNQARRSPQPAEQALETLSQRIKALSHTQGLLTDRNWRSAELNSIIEPELVPVYGKARVQLGGPKVEVNAKAALAISMAIHELATNAAKYGALKEDDGSVSLRWSVEDSGLGPKLILRWRESGAKEMPDAASVGRGFGTRLIDGSISGTLGGSVERDYKAGGLECTLTIDMARATEMEEDALELVGADLTPHP